MSEPVKTAHFAHEFQDDDAQRTFAERIGRLSKRKPHNGYAGYVAERKVWHTVGGHIVLIDREKGGDWIAAAHRWVLIWEPLPETLAEKHIGARLVDCKTRKEAYALMNAAAAMAGAGEFFYFVNDEDMEGLKNAE